MLGPSPPLFSPRRRADPLDKAEAYAALRGPYLLNDLGMQRTLMDRRRVYDLLAESGIDVPHHVYASRDGYVSTSIQRERGGGRMAAGAYPRPPPPAGAAAASRSR